MFRHLCFSALLFLPIGSYAAGKIKQIDVQNDVVYFSTEEAKTGELPACVASENAELWSLSLSNQTGRAMYALLMTALSTNQELEITSAGDCGAAESTERAASVKFLSSSLNQDLSGTIFDSLIEVSNYLVDEEGKNTNEMAFFNNVSRKSQGYTAYFRDGRKQLLGGKVNGKGWLTGILTPRTYLTTDITIEIKVDGQTYTINSAKQKNGSRRFLMGVVDEEVFIDKHGSPFAYKLASPAKVVALGKAIPFYNSLEVWVTMEGRQEESGAGGHGLLQYVLGSPN